MTGFPISALPFNAQVEVMLNWAQTRLSKVVCVANVHMLMEGHWNPDFANLLKNADLLTPDGMPLVWMTSLMKGHSQDRVAGMELMLALCEKAQAKGVSLFFLGSTAEMLTQICEQLAVDFPELQVVGRISPPFRKLSEKENEAIATQINESGAGLVFVSLGCPKQERWMSEHRGKVQAVMIGLGGAFSVYAGEKQWAPAWVRKYGMEWCYRLGQEPRRLWKRYASTIPPFLWLALKQIVKLRLGLDPNLAFRQQRLGHHS
ncbi:MAG: WecB/TagA/CpsF family glycosyltransferase [Phormidesmis sp.]